jgi:hypothetical protein
MMTDNKEFELRFMYKKYEELCKAYKKLAQKTSTPIVAHDMSHMSFKKEEREDM